MITSAIGKTFLNAYNEEYGKNYDAKTFFEKVFFPIIFGGTKYALWVQNSPFVQGLTAINATEYGKKIKDSNGKINIKPLDEGLLQSMLKEFEDKVDKSNPDASIAIGFPAQDTTATTSGQVTDMLLPTNKEEVFLSWIGSALAVGIKGGFNILFNQKDILMDLFNGWKYYRHVLDNTSQLKGNKINTWNGQWLVHYYDRRTFDKDKPLAGFSPYTGKDGTLTVDLQTWTKVLIGIARVYQDIEVMGYVYNIGQTNTTLGFIPFLLTQIRRPIQLYEKYFGMDDGRKAESLWGTAIGFKAACRNGVIGLKAMEPKGLTEYIQGGKLPKPEKNDEQRISYNTYKIWILSMLNYEELWQESEELAQLLSDASVNKEKKISTKSANTVNEVLSAVNKKQFVEAVTKVVSSVGATDRLVSIVKDVHSMPTDNVPYFLALVRFQYAALNNKSNH